MRLAIALPPGLAVEAGIVVEVGPEDWKFLEEAFDLVASGDYPHEDGYWICVKGWSLPFAWIPHTHCTWGRKWHRMP